jgi:hypothetical protein
VVGGRKVVGSFCSTSEWKRLLEHDYDAGVSRLNYGSVTTPLYLVSSWWNASCANHAQQALIRSFVRFS